jgi:outer membrane protein, multidrug efflux system
MGSVKYTGILLLFFFSGCSLEPPYHPPCVETPVQWKNAPLVEEPAPCAGCWWELFDDPTLDSLENLALENNPSLMAAIERLEQAKDLAKIIRSKLLPQLNLTPFYSNQGVLTRLFGPNYHPSPFLIREHQLQYLLPLSLNYELDIFGKIRSEYKSAKLFAQSTAEAVEEAKLLLTADLASAYFGLRLQDALIDLFSATLATRRKAFEINLSRYEGQVDNAHPLWLSQIDLSNVEAQYEDAVRLRLLYENQIAVLVGLSPSLFHVDHNPLVALPPVVPPGVPSEVLLRRPDIAEEERIIASIHARLGIAYASFFPSVTLRANVGFLSPISGDFLKGVSRWWDVATQITQLVFDAGAASYGVDLTWAEYREMVDRYQQRVLIAFQEVEDSLSNLQRLSSEMESIHHAVEAAAAAYAISMDRYLEGADFYLPVAEDERTLLDSERAYRTLLGLSYFNTVQLIKAMGGGW